MFEFIYKLDIYKNRLDVFLNSTVQDISLSRWSPIHISTPFKGLNFGEQTGTRVFPLVIAVQLLYSGVKLVVFIVRGDVT